MNRPKFDIESMKNPHNFDSVIANRKPKKLNMKELFFADEDARDFAEHGINPNCYHAYEVMEMSFRYRNFPINDI